MFVRTLCFVVCFASAASAAPDPATYLTGGIGPAYVGGGSFDGTSAFAGRAALGIPIASSLALEFAASGATDLFGEGYSTGGLSAGVRWQLLGSLSVAAAARWRSFTDQVSLGEAIGITATAGLAIALCGDDPDCVPDFSERHTEDLGLELSIASRWEWEVFTLGIEWLSMHQPLVILDQVEKHTTDDDEIIRSWPGFSAFDLPVEARVLNVSVGLAF